MRTNWMASVIVSVAMLVAASHAAAQTDFQWHGQLTSGQTIEIKGINGDVRATASSSGEVEVTAARSARRSNPADVRIEVVPHAGGVTICAVYPTAAGRAPNSCEPGREGRSNTRDNDTVVHFDVRVPYGVGFVGRTVNGEINAESLQARCGSLHGQRIGAADDHRRGARQHGQRFGERVDGPRRLVQRRDIQDREWRDHVDAAERGRRGTACGGVEREHQIRLSGHRDRPDEPSPAGWPHRQWRPRAESVHSQRQHTPAERTIELRIKNLEFGMRLHVWSSWHAFQILNS